MSDRKLHADDTPVPVLAPGHGKTKLGRLWRYVRDDRPAGDATAPAVWFAYSPDRRGEHPYGHLAEFKGTLQADGYAGFNRLYDSGRIQEAACWAHARRKFFDLHEAHASPITAEALERIGSLYAIESEIRGRSPNERRRERHTRVRPLLTALQNWFKEALTKLSRKSETAAAISYALRRWPALVRYCDDALRIIRSTGSPSCCPGMSNDLRLERSPGYFRNAGCGNFLVRRQAIYQCPERIGYLEQDPFSFDRRRSFRVREQEHLDRPTTTTLFKRDQC